MVSAFFHGDLTDKHWTRYFQFTLTSSPRCAVVFVLGPNWDPDPEMVLQVCGMCWFEPEEEEEEQEQKEDEEICGWTERLAGRQQEGGKHGDTRGAEGFPPAIYIRLHLLVLILLKFTGLCNIFPLKDPCRGFSWRN